MSHISAVMKIIRLIRLMKTVTHIPAALHFIRKEIYPNYHFSVVNINHQKSSINRQSLFIHYTPFLCFKSWNLGVIDYFTSGMHKTHDRARRLYKALSKLLILPQLYSENQAKLTVLLKLMPLIRTVFVFGCLSLKSPGIKSAPDPCVFLSLLQSLCCVSVKCQGNAKCWCLRFPRCIIYSNFYHFSKNCWNLKGNLKMIFCDFF